MASSSNTSDQKIVEQIEWVDAIKETLEKLELSYVSLEDEYKEIFLDIACMLKGKPEEDAIRILESCGLDARNGLKVLEQRSLITVDEYGRLDMHAHLEEMGKNIVRREHPNEPNKHSRLWIKEQIEDILANDMGTEETRCLKLDESRLNSRIFMKGLGKMKKLRCLEVNFAYYDSEYLDDTSQYFPNSLKYLKCTNYPFLYLPRTFQANNLVGLEIQRSRMVQLWKEGEKKILKNLKFLYLPGSNLKTFDFTITPNLETLSLKSSSNLDELCMPVSCHKLKHLDISDSKLRTFDLGLTPNLETLSLVNCADFEELHVSDACPNLKFLNLRKSRLRSLDLELIPNLESLDLAGCDELVEINDPLGFLKNTLDGGQDEFIQIIVDKMSHYYGVVANSVGMVTRVKDYFFQFIAMLSPVLNKLVEAMDLNPGVTFSFIVTCLLALIGINSQNVTGFPFNTHPNAIKVPVASLLIYAFASMAKHAVSVARLHHTSVYAIIASLGRISSVCLFVTSLAILICI